MPTILTINKFKFHFYSKEGKRAHIHVVNAEIEVVVWLDTLKIKKSNAPARIERLVLELVAKHQETLQEAWDEYFN